MLKLLSPLISSRFSLRSRFSTMTATISLDIYDPEQARLMEEMCILVDPNDKVIGYESKKVTHLMANINKGMLHRAFSVFLFDSSNRLLLQQRADAKITFPGFWTNTCCSHPLARQDELLELNHQGVLTAAVRKLDHELGINQVSTSDFTFLTRIHYLASSDSVWGEHEVDYILFAKKDLSYTIEPNEVKNARYVTQSELRDLLDRAVREPDTTKITPWFQLICNNFIFKWWDKLIVNDLNSCVDSERIWNLT